MLLGVATLEGAASSVELRGLVEGGGSRRRKTAWRKARLAHGRFRLPPTRQTRKSSRLPDAVSARGTTTRLAPATAPAGPAPNDDPTHHARRPDRDPRPHLSNWRAAYRALLPDYDPGGGPRTEYTLHALLGARTRGAATPSSGRRPQQSVARLCRLRIEAEGHSYYVDYPATRPRLTGPGPVARPDGAGGADRGGAARAA